MKKVLIVLSALMLVHTSLVRAISVGDIVSNAEDLVSIVPSMIGNGQAIVDGSKELPNVISEQFTIAKQMQSASSKASSEDSKHSLLFGATFHIYDATQELAKFVVSCGGFVKDLGSFVGIFGLRAVADKAKEFGDNIKQPVDHLIIALDQMKEQLIVMGGDPEATLSKTDADKDKAERAKEKATLATKQLTAKPVATKMTTGDYAKAALQMLPIVVRLVDQSKKLVNSGSALPSNIQKKLARLNIKMANLKKAEKAAESSGDDGYVKAIALSINFELLDVAEMLGVFCANAGDIIKSFGEFAKIVKQPTIATKASTLGVKIKAQTTVLTTLLDEVKKEMKNLGANPETGMKEVKVAKAPAAEVKQAAAAAAADDEDAAPQAPVADDEAQENEERIGLAEFGA